MRSAFTDRRGDILPRSLRELLAAELAAEAAQVPNGEPRRRQRRTRAAGAPRSPQ
ncbi:hypothetical protein [Actinomadura chokoriensis]|uniref:Uncharacterized protein n=1 Tax=Actinomadura chokoriensis TaxID=454156 RepID=A0ABV4QTQ0_9ACTN